MENKKCILFDLDGTLLPLDLDSFLDRYFKALSKELSDLFDPENFINNLMTATEAMIRNDGSKTNQEVFMETFFSRIDIEDPKEQEKLKNRFDQFYKEKFPALKEGINPEPLAQKIVELAKSSERELVLATNPVFPREAVLERINWAGLNADDFSLITSYENMHYCKPNPAYYQEILDYMNIEAKEAVMIGNDPREDIVAGKVGLRTYLINNYKIERENAYTPDWEGTLKDFYSYLKESLQVSLS